MCVHAFAKGVVRESTRFKGRARALRMRFKGQKRKLLRARGSELLIIDVGARCRRQSHGGLRLQVERSVTKQIRVSGYKLKKRQGGQYMYVLLQGTLMSI